MASFVVVCGGAHTAVRDQIVSKSRGDCEDSTSRSGLKRSAPGFQLFTRVGNPIFARLFFSRKVGRLVISKFHRFIEK